MMCVWVIVKTRGEQQVIYSYSLSYSFETRSLTEPRAGLMIGGQQASVILLPITAVLGLFISMCRHAQLFT